MITLNIHVDLMELPQGTVVQLLGMQFVYETGDGTHVRLFREDWNTLRRLWNERISKTTNGQPAKPD